MIKLFSYIFGLLILSTSFLFAQNLVKEKIDSKFIFEKLNFHRDQHNYDSAIYYSDKLIAFNRNRGKEPAIISSYFQKSNTLKLFNKESDAFRMMLSTYDNFCNEHRLQKNCQPCSHIYHQLYDFMLIMRDYRKGLKYLNMNCNITMNHLYYYKKANLYCLLEQSDSALMSTAEFITIANGKSDPRMLMRAYNQHGLIAKKINNIDLAIEAFSSAIEIADTTGLKNSTLNFVITGNLGSCYYLKKNYDKAYGFLSIDSEGSLKGNQILSYLNAELNLAEIDVLRKNYNKATNRIKLLLTKYRKELLIDQELKLVELLIKVYKDTGDDLKYDYYSKQWINLQKAEFQTKIKMHQKLLDEYSTNTMKHVLQILDAEKKLVDQKLLLENKEKEKNKLRNWLLITSLILAIVLILFFFWRYKSNQDKKTILKESQLNSVKKEQEILELKIKEENRNVQTLSLELLNKKEFSKHILNRLAEIENISKVDMKTMEIFIHNELNIKSTRAQLQNQMGDLSGAFYNQLKINYPNLTHADFKLSAMVVMDMSNKEIAISKNISTDSVKKSKNRLKKKLNLTKEDNLRTHLKELL